MILATIQALLFFILFTGYAYSYSYDVRNAFCTDKMSRFRTRYENAKIYESCMLNADFLIRQHEENRERVRSRLQKSNREYQAREEEKRREEEKKMDELFSEFNK